MTITTAEAIAIADSPAMPVKGVNTLQERLRNTNCFLEYGSGGSTILAGSMGVRQILAVESDKAFLNAVVEKFQAKFGTSLTLTPLYVDIGPTKAWGFPIEVLKAQSFPAYCAAPWDILSAGSLSPDLILIDGRFRVASFLTSLAFAKKGCHILFDDYRKRDHYHVVEKHISLTALHGRLAEFVVNDEVDIAGLILSILKHCVDPR